MEPTPPCEYEGEIISICARGDAGHLRRCNHPNADWDNCRRIGGNMGNGEQSCNKCPLHPQYASVGDTRHLLYYICPMRGPVWRWNVEQLKRRIGLFNGKRVIAISTAQVVHRPGMMPTYLDNPDDVRQAFDGLDCEFVEVRNVRELGEVVAWPALWSRVLPGGHGDVTFYAHAKGVSKANHPTVRRWTEILYETNLDYWPLILRHLKDNPLVGGIKKNGRCFDQIPQSSWHYTGTFYWVRNADLAARHWRNLPQQWAATEAIVGCLFHENEGAAIFHSDHGTKCNMYSVEYVGRMIEPSYRKWRSENEWAFSSNAGPSPATV